MRYSMKNNTKKENLFYCSVTFFGGNISQHTARMPCNIWPDAFSVSGKRLCGGTKTVVVVVVVVVFLVCFRQKPKMIQHLTYRTDWNSYKHALSHTYTVHFYHENRSISIDLRANAVLIC